MRYQDGASEGLDTATTEQALEHARPLDHPPDYAIDLLLPNGRRTTWALPKPRDANLRYRQKLHALTERSERARLAMLAACSAKDAGGFLVWLNTYGWTFKQLKIDEHGRQTPILGGGVDVPFITWPVQDDLATELIRCIETGTNAAVDKSRDMGLTWLIVAVFTWHWLFRPGTNFQVLSMTEEEVDNPGEPSSIFWKIDYLLRMLPGWMVPPHKRTFLKLVRTDTPTTIVGKSTTGRKGRSGRVTATLFDEAGFIDVLKRLWVSMRSTAGCMIANSTAAGPGFFSRLVRSPQVHQLRAMWWEHPEKGRGRYLATEPDGTTKIRSPWFNQREAEAVDRMEIAQELEADHQAAGYVFYDDRVLTRHMASNCVPPLYMGRLEFTGEGDRDIALANQRDDQFAWHDVDDGAWAVWCELDDDGSGAYRPPQDRTYVFGIDVSLGLGRSESACCVTDLESGEQVGEFTTKDLDPAEFARQMYAASLWWGGARGTAFVCWEANGGGQIFGKHMKRLRHRWLYYHTHEDRRSRQTTDKFGWHSNPAAKKDLLTEHRVALARDEWIPRSSLLVEQCREYVHFDNGGVGPGELETDDPAAQDLHGDKVIAAALSRYAMTFAHRCRPPERVAPVGSPAWRRLHRARRDRGQRDELLDTIASAR